MKANSGGVLAYWGGVEMVILCCMMGWVNRAGGFRDQSWWGAVRIVRCAGYNWKCK